MPPTVIDKDSSILTVVNEFHVTPEQGAEILETFPPLMTDVVLRAGRPRLRGGIPSMGAELNVTSGPEGRERTTGTVNRARGGARRGRRVRGALTDVGSVRPPQQKNPGRGGPGWIELSVGKPVAGVNSRGNQHPTHAVTSSQGA